MKPEYATAACVGQHWLFDALDLEDDSGNFIGEEYPLKHKPKPSAHNAPSWRYAERKTGS